jgi:hypothetical protein
MQSATNQKSAEDIICYGVCGRVVSRQGTTLIDNRIYREVVRICDDCVKDATSCSVCGIPAASSTTKLFRGANEFDNTYRCFICSQTIVDQNRAITAYNSVVSALKGRLDMAFSSKVPPLELVTFEKLQELQKMFGASYEINGLFYFENTPKGKEPKISILAFLPMAWFIEASAHELAHAWQSDFPAFKTQDAKLKEGFAVWVACQVLQDIVDRPASNTSAQWIKQDAQALIAGRKADTDSIFGEGLQYFLLVEQKGGREAVFKVAKTGNI